jgi:hypothetical protein
MKMKILSVVVISALIAGLSGCMSAEEKKAKDIAVKKIIEDDKREKEFRKSMNKVDDRDYSKAFKEYQELRKSKKINN